jgi:RES domain-containing protein
MKVWRICRAKFAGEAFSGEGARRYGGRWNSPGVAMVYSSTSLALAAIELFVHLEPNQQPDDLVAIAAELPDEEPLERVEPDQLPRAWWKNDYAALRAMGDKWIREKRSLAMEVPSAALRAEWNVLLNPLHPSAAEIRIEKPEPFRFDARMFR